MDKNDCVELGYLAKAHGVRGEIKAVFDVHDLNEYARRGSFWLAKGEAPLRELKLRKIRILNEQDAILAFEGIDDRNQAELLKGETIFLPVAELPKLGEGHYYLFEVEGFQVIDARLGPLGKVQGFLKTPAGEVLVMDFEEKEVLIPMADELVGQPDMNAKTLPVTLPEGLLEVYLGDDWRSEG